MAYYILATKGTDGRLHIQFGDKSRAVVKQEKADTYRGQSAVIIRADSARQKDCDIAVRSMEQLLGLTETPCTYPNCKCIVRTSTSQPEPVCPKGLTK